MTVKVLDDRGAGTTGARRRGHPLRRRQRRADHQPQPRERAPTTRACARRWRRPRPPTRCSSPAPATAAPTSTRRRSTRSRSPSANVVGVAATEPEEGRALPDFSNYGRLTVPVAAPGVDVISTSMSGGYEVKSGTSMAAPHVAGVAALMASVAPNLPAADLRALLLQNAARAPVPVSSGYVDALGSVLAASKGSTSYEQTQPPQVRVLSRDARKGRDDRARPDRAQRRQPGRRPRRRQARRPHGRHPARRPQRAQRPPPHPRRQQARSTSRRSPPTAARSRVRAPAIRTLRAASARRLRRERGRRGMGGLNRRARRP